MCPLTKATKYNKLTGNPRSEKPLGLSIGLYFPTFPQKFCPGRLTEIVFPDDYSSFNFLNPIQIFI